MVPACGDGPFYTRGHAAWGAAMQAGTAQKKTGPACADPGPGSNENCVIRLKSYKSYKSFTAKYQLAD
jgi:hypothetical protein